MVSNLFMYRNEEVKQKDVITTTDQAQSTSDQILDDPATLFAMAASGHSRHVLRIGVGEVVADTSLATPACPAAQPS